MPTYLYKCGFCKNTESVRQMISEVKPGRACGMCGHLMQRDWKAEGVHGAPVPGTGNWKWARDLEDKAKRVTVSPNAEKYLAEDSRPT